ncbi:hypothetical protein C8P68_1202 [Mucilaginibacter yixingensis]|uniref:Uncharacterized protein n=1 Tax=Mucilaginibacter yixingensis TaxID=1295612 RepID=A0A2T5J4A5_9SPHI|nr:hypothetical protein [Mucilaginibacter yixingensis]PTQ91688.1 hypothetical protein C8P68_1202 [Mucilaginibacter yixingensis]
MDKHPLHNYFRFVQNKEYLGLHRRFNAVDEFIANTLLDYSSNDLDEPNIIWNEKEQVYSFLFKDGSESKISFETYLVGKLKSWDNYFENYLREKLFQLYNEDLKKSKFLKIIRIELDNLSRSFELDIQNATNKEDNKVLETIRLHISGLKNHLLKYISVNEETKSNVVLVGNNEKIKWLGNINALTTLLLDLNDGKNNLRKQFLDLTKQELEHFILNNFVDKDGREFSKSTISTYLQPDKRIEDTSKKQPITLRD